MNQINLVVVNFESVCVLFPQGGIATIEMIDNVESAADVVGAIGRLRSGGREWPVYSLDADLNRRSVSTVSNKYCVAFDIDGQPAFSLACDQVSSLTLQSSDQIKPLQSCMRDTKNPVEALLLQDDRLMLMSQVEVMHRFLTAELAA
jgi:hypothetical protein